jgi:Flp pilus assembly protein protease CpaA
VYAQLLLAISFAFGSYQDVRDREVSDLVWIPAAGGVAIIMYEAFRSPGSPLLETELLKLGFAAALVVVLYYFGAVGEADLIALAFFFADPYLWSFFFAMVGVAVVMGSHIVYRLLKSRPIRTVVIPVDQFVREPFWVPVATIFDGMREEVSADVNFAREEVEAKKKEGMLVEAKYGTPTLAYYGIGYILYLLALLAFNYSLFASLP